MRRAALLRGIVIEDCKGSRTDKEDAIFLRGALHGLKAGL